jgi:dipeptidyl aminopeptidase/acylaminoacyl peptidase
MLRESRRLLILIAVTATTAASAEGSRLSAERMWALQRLGAPAISPDGSLAVLPVTRYDLTENKGLTDLWLVPVRGGEARQLTSDAAADTQPAFSPDGRSVAFVSRRAGDEASQVYVIALEGGEARRLTSVPTGAESPKWFPDGRRIAFISPVWNDLVRWEDQARKLKERESSKMSARVWERAPISHWDHFLDDREPHLFAVGLEDGSEPMAITRTSGYFLPKTETDAYSYDISPDGLEVALVSNVDATGVAPNLDVIVLAACGCKAPKNITQANPVDDDDPRYSPDGRYIAFSQQRIRGFYADRARLMVYDRGSGLTKGLTEDWNRSVTEPSWLPKGRSLLASVDDAATQRVYRFALDGAKPRAVTAQRSFGNLAVGRTATIAIRQSFSEPPTLVRLDATTGNATALTHFNDAALGATSLGEVRSVTYKGARDAEIQMWVVYPPGFDPGRKYPVYMLLHGGPHNAMPDGTQWRWNAHVFASWGYIVTWHNFHGSSGFGQEFADSINPDLATLPYEDTIKAAEWLMAQPYVDRERMAAGGGSYGGYLASTLLGREHPFKTLIAHAAVYDMYTQVAADYGAEKPRFGHHWERPDEFARISPHMHAGRFDTPTLVIHGQLDLRVPVNHGIELFNTLQSKGVPSKLVYFPDENHWVLEPQNSLFWYRTVQEWLAKYVPPGAR